MTLNELIENFRDAILGLLPAMDRVGIAWTPTEAYDDWDEIVSVLYNKTVCEVLRFSLPEGEQDAFKLPAYDLFLKDYDSYSFIQLITSGQNMKTFTSTETIYSLHSLSFRSSPFDTIDFREISLEGKPISDTLYSVPIEKAKLGLRWRPTDGRSFILLEELDL